MTIPGTTEFRSRRCPELVVTIRRPTFGMRRRLAARFADARTPLADIDVLEELWSAMVRRVAGVTIAGRDPKPAEFFLNAPEELVAEIALELKRVFTTLPTRTLEEDLVLRALLRNELAAVEARIREREAAMRTPATAAVQ